MVLRCPFLTYHAVNSTPLFRCVRNIHCPRTICSCILRTEFFCIIVTIGLHSMLHDSFITHCNVPDTLCWSQTNPSDSWPRAKQGDRIVYHSIKTNIRYLADAPRSVEDFDNPLFSYENGTTEGEIETYLKHYCQRATKKRSRTNGWTRDKGLGWPGSSMTVFSSSGQR